MYLVCPVLYETNYYSTQRGKEKTDNFIKNSATFKHNFLKNLRFSCRVDVSSLSVNFYDYEAYCQYSGTSL